MKPANQSSRSELKPARPFLSKSDKFEKRLESRRKNLKRLRIVQSVNVGHVRGGHGYH